MSQEKFIFNEDIQHLINLIKTTFSSDKELFLRELIFNASDALNKIRFKSLTGYPISKEPNFRIRIIPDKNSNTLTITDTGIGMTRDDLVKKLVAIQKPGIQALIKILSSGASVSTIGSFNIGFYSAFLNTEKVSVISKSDEEDRQWKWESTGDGTFTVSDDSQSPEQLVRGTKVVLYLTEDIQEFLEEDKLKEVIQRRCDFIDFPIELQVKKAVEQGEEIEQVKKKMKLESGTEKAMTSNIGEFKAEKTQEGNLITYEWEKINKTKPIWTKKPQDVTKAEYAAFYKSLTHDPEDPLAVRHFSAEGQLEFTAILFIPRNALSDSCLPLKKNCNIRLYIRRVFITDDFEELLPEYLNFVKGVVDSEDLPLNVPQDALHYSNVLKLTRKSLVRKAIELIQEISENKELYNLFYEQFSRNIKLGFYEDDDNRTKLAEFLRFYTSNSGDRLVSLREYVERMKQDQKDIYYLIDTSITAAASSPIIVPFIQKGYEVIYMIGPIDEYVIDELEEYHGKKLTRCTKGEMEVES